MVAREISGRYRTREIGRARTKRVGFPNMGRPRGGVRDTRTGETGGAGWTPTGRLQNAGGSQRLTVYMQVASRCRKLTCLVGLYRNLKAFPVKSVDIEKKHFD